MLIAVCYEHNCNVLLKTPIVKKQLNIKLHVNKLRKDCNLDTPDPEVAGVKASEAMLGTV